jgi:hypothetical protein
VAEPPIPASISNRARVVAVAIVAVLVGLLTAAVAVGSQSSADDPAEAGDVIASAATTAPSPSTANATSTVAPTTIARPSTTASSTTSMSTTSTTSTTLATPTTTTPPLPTTTTPMPRAGVWAPQGSGTLADPYVTYDDDGQRVPIIDGDWELSFVQGEIWKDASGAAFCGLTGYGDTGFIWRVYVFATWRGDQPADVVELAKRVGLVDTSGRRYDTVSAGALSELWRSQEMCSTNGDLMLAPPAEPDTEAAGGLYWYLPVETLDDFYYLVIDGSYIWV